MRTYLFSLSGKKKARLRFDVFIEHRCFRSWNYFLLWISIVSVARQRKTETQQAKYIFRYRKYIFYRERFARKLQTRREGLTNREAPSQQLFRGSTFAIYLFFRQFNYIDRSYGAAFIANACSWHGCDQRICIRIFASGK